MIALDKYSPPYVQPTNASSTTVDFSLPNNTAEAQAMTFVANEMAEANRLKKIEIKLNLAIMRSKYKDNDIVLAILAGILIEIEPTI